MAVNVDASGITLARHTTCGKTTAAKNRIRLLLFGVMASRSERGAVMARPGRVVIAWLQEQQLASCSAACGVAINVTARAVCWSERVRYREIKEIDDEQR